MMPAFGHDGILKSAEISAVADYVRSLSGNAAEPRANLTAGKKIFADNCAACHGDDAKGSVELGAPNLTTQVWLYGSTKADIVHRIMVGGGGVMPAWGQKLDAPTIKALTVFVHSLGGGQ
jgi:cytochrome c oxidase cbb3-type subunit 3